MDKNWKRIIPNDMWSRLINRISLVVVVIIIYFHSIPASSIKIPIRVDSSQESSSRFIEAGSFVISNTSDQYTLFQETVYAIEMSIGTTWELTINISNNSSSKAAFFLESQASDWFEGPEDFQVNPNETRSEFYVSHCASDETAGFNFRYSLINGDRGANGNCIICNIFY